MPILLKRFHHRGAVPRWAHDRAKLWNGAETRERNGKRGKNAEAFNLRRCRSPARNFFDRSVCVGRRHERMLGVTPCNQTKNVALN
jgi:hypothetical protein